MSIETILSRLQGVRKTRGDAWVARCPAHADKSPSLSLRWTPDSTVLLHCFGGCEPIEVLGAIGMKFDDLFPERPKTHSSGYKRPWPAADVLEALGDEALIVILAGRAMERGEVLDPPRMGRLSKAINRIEEGRRLARGRT